MGATFPRSALVQERPTFALVSGDGAKKNTKPVSAARQGALVAVESAPSLGPRVAERHVNSRTQRPDEAQYVNAATWSLEQLETE